MRIRNILLIGSVISIILVLIFSIVVYISFNRIAEENERELIANGVHTSVSELTILMNDYLAGRTDRSIQQWNARYTTSAEIIEPRREKELETIKSSYADLKPLFLQITDGRAGSELERRLVAQVLIKSQAIITDSSLISNDAYNKAIEAQKTANNSMIIGLIILVIVLIGLSYFTARRIGKPIGKITKEVHEITKGNLDIQLEKSNVTEVQNLTNSLNRILASMKLSILRTGASGSDIGLGDAIKAKEEFERKYNILFQGIRDPIVLADRDTRNIVNVNKAAEHVLGYSKKELLSMKIEQIHPKDFTKKVIPMFNAFADGKVKGVVHLDFLTKNNKIIPVSGNIGKVEIGDKEYIQGIFRDVSKDKIVEETLKQEKEFSQSVMDTIPFGMDIVDEGFNLLYVNKIFSKLFGDKLLGKKCFEVYRDNKKQCKDCPMRKKVKVGETMSLITSGVAGGRTFRITHTGFVLPDGRKAILEFFQELTGTDKDKKVGKEIDKLVKKKDFEKAVERLLTRYNDMPTQKEIEEVFGKGKGKK